ncbi:MAG: extracellular solute-binding protein [Bacilli bacterium]|nr:extracellular solute-binding protein [Bacilli bacterium]
MKIRQLLIVALMSAPFAFSVTACNKGNSTASEHTIRILNLEDYIYIKDPENGYDEEDLVDQFAAYANEKFGFDDVKVVYDTSDTNESEYNDLLTGRINYDLVCTSDYMLQKFVREGLVTELDTSKLVNYNTYASKSIKQRLDEIEVVKDGVTVKLENYAVGYMWGTLGLLVNPNYSLMEKAGLDMDAVTRDAQNWDILWNSNYKNTASIKNSMRDTYAVALMHGYDEKLNELKESHDTGTINDETYNERLSQIFNLTDSEVTLPMVRKELDKLKGNIFGMEVDSGKQDIVTGKIGLNLAWSGDAVYSMDQAEDPELVSNPFELYYALPENGSNIWFDGWAIPTNKNRSQITYDLAMAFLDFLSDPEIAAKNMDYTGYTPFIGGDSILELTREWYDIREYLVYYGEECESMYYIDPYTDEEVEVSYEDCHFEADNDPAYDEVSLYYYIGEETHDVQDEDGESAFYNSYLLLDDYEEVDLTYFFNDTTVEYAPEDMVFYSDCYLPFENEDGSQNISVGRQFFTQFPNEETILRCAVMADYGDDNVKIVKLWEDFKSNPLPGWAIALIIVEVVIVISVGGYFYISKRIKKKLRNARIEEKENYKN